MMGWKHEDATTERVGGGWLVVIVRSTYMRPERRAIVGSGGFRMHKGAGDSSLATISASSPVLREKKE